jgi:hypothetical protein
MKGRTFVLHGGLWATRSSDTRLKAASVNSCNQNHRAVVLIPVTSVSVEPASRENCTGRR